MKVYTIQVRKTKYYYIDVEASSEEKALDIVCNEYLCSEDIMEKLFDDETCEVEVCGTLN
ncbi:MAG: hypothetical protein ACO22M_00600 [Candidatus Nanopelagicaceae bacterium]